MILKTVLIQKFRSIENSGIVRFEPDVTCLVGKNESGKTAFLEALYQANPSGGPGCFTVEVLVRRREPRWITSDSDWPTAVRRMAAARAP